MPSPPTSWRKFAELLLADASFEESAGVDARRRVSLDVQQVAAVIFIDGVEKVVEADVVERRRRSEAGDVTAHAGALGVGAHDGGHRVPADDRADAPFQHQIAGAAVFLVERDGVKVSGVGRKRDVRAGTASLVDQLLQQVMGALRAFEFQHRVEGVEPLLGFLRVDIGNWGHALNLLIRSMYRSTVT